MLARCPTRIDFTDILADGDADHAANVGIECHAGHGLDYDTVSPIAAIPNIEELNIGHFLIGESIFRGLPAAIEKMRQLIDIARTNPAGVN